MGSSLAVKEEKWVTHLLTTCLHSSLGRGLTVSPFFLKIDVLNEVRDLASQPRSAAHPLPGLSISISISISWEGAWEEGRVCCAGTKGEG